MELTATAPQPMEPILRPSDRDNQPSLDADVGMPTKSSREVWEYIRELDEGENWVERNRVVPKSDHILYTKCAQEFVGELVDNLPVFSKEQPGGPTVEERQGEERREEEEERRGEKKAEDYQYMKQFSDKDFQTTAAQLDMDYLERVTSSSTDEPSVLARQSLYVKFDPLVGTGSPNKSAQKDIPTAVRVGRVPSNDLLMLDTPPHIHGDHTDTSRHDLLTISPMAGGVVGHTSSKEAPAFTSVSVGSSPRLNSTLLDASPHLPSSPHTATSHPTPSPIPETDNLVKVLKFAEDDVAHLVEAARQEERRKFEAEMALMREELLHKESSAQKRVDRAQKEIQAMKTEVMMHVSDKAKLEEEVERWRQLVECHEETETKICDCYEELKGEVSKLEQQRDQTLADFESLEKSFADLHQRYLKLKSIAQALQKNESKLQSYVAELEGLNRTAEENFQALQRDVEEKLAEANQTFDIMRKEHASDVAVANANVKKLQLQVASLEKALKGKDQEKEELAQICDDLMKELRNRE